MVAPDDTLRQRDHDAGSVNRDIHVCITRRGNTDGGSHSRLHRCPYLRSGRLPREVYRDRQPVKREVGGAQGRDSDERDGGSDQDPRAKVLHRPGAGVRRGRVGVHPTPDHQTGARTRGLAEERLSGFSHDSVRNGVREQVVDAVRTGENPNLAGTRGGQRGVIRDE